MGDTKDLALLLDAKIPIIVVESPDEARVLDLLLQLAIKRSLPFYQWSITSGMQRGGFETPSSDTPKLAEPDEMLKHIANQNGPALFALCDLHPYLKGEDKNVRYLKDAALDFDQLGNTIILISHALEIPPEIGRMAASLDLRLPSDEELMSIVRKQAQEWARINKGKKVKTDSETLSSLISNLRGVTHADAEMLIRHAIFKDGAITDDDIPEMNRLKFDLLDSEGVLHYEYDTEKFADVAGQNNLKEWLKIRHTEFLTDETEDRPKGVLLLGVQGSGKSLAAKAVAGNWGLPLLRLDFGSLYNKFFGETERNLRNSLKQAEMMAPCVLWMDEIEKGLATGNQDNATSKRVLGTMLTWMAENSAAVFIVATSNDISALPPELIRKGRIDEVFFVDLPDSQTRKDIFRIHLAKRNLEPGEFDVDLLAETADGFTGAEIEEAVVAARYLANSQKKGISTTDIIASIDRTYPVSVLRSESIQALRSWAKDRTVPA
ncbi:MAG: AAA family ATPase [Pseudomonadales bacterium]|nr:AAA family ATPase [Pseudomonadales bacterium]